MTLVGIGWSVFAVAVVWAIVCSFVVGNMECVDKNTWHGKLIWFSYLANPLAKTTCLYWWQLFLSPLAGLIAMNCALVVCIIGAGLILAIHWIVCPLVFGRYVRVSYRCGIPDDKNKLRPWEAFWLYLRNLDIYRLHGRIPSMGFPPAVWIFLGWLLYATWSSRSFIAGSISSLAEVINNHWSTVSVIGTAVAAIVLVCLALTCLIARYGNEISAAWETLRGKICRKLPPKQATV